MPSPEITALFQQGLERYQANAPLTEVLPIFRSVTEQEPKNCAAWTCLSWLQLLNNQPKLAFETAQKAVKLGPTEAQARVNLVLAMLELQKKGVREYIEQVAQIITLDDEQAQQVAESIDDGLARKPEWPALLKVQKWLAESAD